MSERVTVYDDADQAIKAMNRESLKLYGQLKTKLMKADELHIIRAVTSTSDAALRMAEKYLLWVARQAYAKAMAENGKRKRNAIDRDWLLDYLEETEPVAMYRFIPEWKRKQARLIEALSVTTSPGLEIDKILREIAKMLGWFAISVTDAARVKAFKDIAIAEVMWHSEHDARTCKTCRKLDGKIYDIEEIPPKPHVSCRCWISLVRTGSRRETA